MTDKNLSIKSIITETALVSTVHGIPSIFKTDKRLMKAIWSVVFLISLTYSTYLISQAILNYLEYPVNTKVRYYNEKQVLFPMVTFCNTNAFVTSYATNFVSKLYKNVSNTSANIVDGLNKELNNVKGLDVLTWISAFSQNHTEKKKFGFELNQTLLKCQFNNKDCDLNDFTWFYHFYNGNCFAFNKFNTNNKIQVSGDSNKLTLELFAGSEKNIITPTNGFGFSLMIYNQTEDDITLSNSKSIKIKTNTETNIAISRVFLKKLPSPYSECVIDLESATIDSHDSSLYKQFFKANMTYKQMACFDYCFQENVVKRCKCRSSPSNGMLDFDGIKMCSTSEEFNCTTSLYFNEYKANNFQGKCDAQCPLECNSKYLNIQMSYQNFPSTYYAKYLMENNFFLSNLTEQQRLTIEDVKASVSRVNVYLDDLNYQYVEEIATYSVNDLIGTVGGLLGLFIGASFLSFFEIFEILFEIVYFKLKSKINIEA